MATVGENILRILEERGMTRKQLADKAGVCRSTIDTIVRNNHKTRISTIKIIVEALEVDVTEIYPEGTIEKIPCNSIGEIIQKLTLQKGITDTELANMSGLSHATIRSVKQNKHTPQENTLKAIADALGVKANKLFPKKL